jgi:hypothetical protein
MDYQINRLPYFTVVLQVYYYFRYPSTFVESIYYIRIFTVELVRHIKILH